jgi:serine/threonine protein kinase
MAEAATRAPAPLLPHDDALLGTCLGGRFHLRALIGTGAYGRVYRAEQVTLLRDVAIKVLDPRLAQDPEFVDQLHAEALITSRLSHPNIVSVIDFGRTEDGLVYIVMELLRGCTLTELNAKAWPMPLDRVGPIMKQILHGLEEAHALGIVHADLKSDNILVEQRASGDLVKVVDFGIARLLDPFLPRHGGLDVKAGTISGTPEYMAPEVIRGHKPTPSADLYAAGVVLYQLLTGRLPFENPAFMKVLRSHLEDPVPALAVARPESSVPPAWEAVVHRALAKAPAARFQSAAEFREAIEAGLETTGNTMTMAALALGDRLPTEPAIYEHLALGSTQDCPPLPTPHPFSAFQPIIPDERQGRQGEHTTAELDSSALTEFTCAVPRPPQPVVERVTTRARRPRDTVDSNVAAMQASAAAMQASAAIVEASDATVQAIDREQATAPCAAIEQTPAMATTLDFCLGGGSRYALQITASQPEVASAIAATAIDHLGTGARVVVVRADIATKVRRWHPIRNLLRTTLGLPMRPDAVALQAASAHLGSRARTGLTAVFEEPRHVSGILPAPRSRSMARIWSIARAVKEAVCTTRQGSEQLIVWFENLHRYDTESREVVRVLCAGYLGNDLRALLTAAEPFDIGIAEGVTRVTWTSPAPRSGKPALHI